MIFLTCFGLVTVVAQEPIIRRFNPKHYNIETRVTVQNRGAELSRLVVDIPLPAESPEQDVGKIDLNGSQVTWSRDRNLRCAMFDLDTHAAPRNGERLQVAVTYEVTLYDIEVDFSRIGPFRPYDRESETFKKYTISNLPLIDVQEPRLLRVAEDLWQRSNGSSLDYARAAYLHVAQHYHYLNPRTGFHPLKKLLDQGGGDCGNLSSIYISLLRMKGIPARHVVCTRPNNNPHVWAEFYLEGVGWIPVDVTNKNAHPKQDYFGKITHQTNAIILHKGVQLEIKDGDTPEVVTSLQGYAWWIWGKNLENTVSVSHTIKDKDRWWKF